MSVALGFFASTLPELGGSIGYELNQFSQDYIGKSGTLLVLIFAIIIYLIFKIRLSPDAIKHFFEKSQNDINDTLIKKKDDKVQDYNLEEFAVNEEDPNAIIQEPELKVSQFEINKESIGHASELSLEPLPKKEPVFSTPAPLEVVQPPIEDFVVEAAKEEDIFEENQASRLVADFGLFDPTLELSNYKFPTLDLLKEYSSGGITINQEELEENKNRIVETLRNYKIEIAQIKATV